MNEYLYERIYVCNFTYLVRTILIILIIIIRLRISINSDSEVIGKMEFR